MFVMKKLSTLYICIISIVQYWACSLSVTFVYTKNYSWDSLLAPLKILNPVHYHHLGFFRSLIGVTPLKLEKFIDLLEGFYLG